MMEERMIWGSLANLGKVSVRFVKNSRPSDAARTFLPTLARTLQRWKRRSKPLNGKPNHRNVWKRNVSNLDMNQERIESSYSYVPFLLRGNTRITMNEWFERYGEIDYVLSESAKHEENEE